MAARTRGPRLSMRAPRGRPGEFLRATLIVDSDRALVADALEVVLRGHERIRIDGQQAEHPLPAIPAVVSSDDGVEAPTYLRMVLELIPRTIVPGKLPAGRTSYECHFQLPVDLAPSYRGRNFEVSYAIHARLDVAWGADATGAWHLEVGGAPHPGPRTHLLAALPPAPARPLLELQLDTTTWSPGGAVAGALQLSEAQPDAHAVIDLTLVGCETTVHTPPTDIMREHLARHDVGPTPTTFALQVPRVPPSFHGQIGALSWRLELRVVIATTIVALPHRVLVVPIILDQDPPRADRRAPLPSPVLTDEVVEATWQRVAQRFGLRCVGTHITGSLHDCSLALWREPGQRPSLIGDLRYYPLRIGLDVTPERPFEAVARGSNRLAFVCTRLERYAPARAQIWLGDERARVVLYDSGRHEGRLSSLVEQLANLAAALKLTRADLPLPELPVGLQLAAWYALAATLDSSVEPGDLSIRPQRRGLTIAITPLAAETSSDPAGLLATVTTPFPLDPSRQALGTNIQVSDNSISLHVRAIDTDGATLARRLCGLADLAHDLRRADGPYR